MLEEPDLVVLARVIDRGSFARAAAELRVPPSTLSRRVAALEARLGVRALERTTRHLRPTEVGELLASRGRRVRIELEQAERDVADHRATPRGLLRLVIPSPAGDFLGPVFADYLARYPEVRLDLAVADRPLELLADGYDAAICAGTIRGTSAHGVTRLGHIGPVLAASPRYLERVPPIRHPRDLANPAHTIIARTRRSTWEFVHGRTGKKLVVTPAPPRVTVATKAVSAELVLAGVGLALIPRTSVLANPVLRILEPGGYRAAGGPIAFVTPSVGMAPPKVRAFLDVLKAYIGTRDDLFR